MTLNDILVAALSQLDRGHDAQTLDIFRERLTRYANDAQSDIAHAVGFFRTDAVHPGCGVIYAADLARTCVRVLKVEQYGRAVRFNAGEESGSITVPYDADAKITYRCEPAVLSSSNDVSELDPALHPLIVTYVVGRERMAGDVATQRGSDLYMGMYEAAKARLRTNLGETDSFKIINRW